MCVCCIFHQMYRPLKNIISLRVLSADIALREEEMRDARGPCFIIQLVFVDVSRVTKARSKKYIYEKNIVCQ